ncbi:MAG: hypothetical protein LBT53_07840 [Puniceicoccales bacterium]|nr:hypothetical protein [Puniceicoccales bacterium]
MVFVFSAARKSRDALQPTRNRHATDLALCVPRRVATATAAATAAPPSPLNFPRGHR